MPSSAAWQAGLGKARRREPAKRKAPARRFPAYEAAAEERERPSYAHCGIWGVPMFLSCASVVMIASLTAKDGAEGGLFHGLASKQCALWGIGLLGAGVCRLFSLSFIRRWSGVFWLMSILMASLTRVPGIGVRAGGAWRWIDLGFITFQPLEILTLAVPLFLAKHLGKSEREGLKSFLWPSLTLTVCSAAPVVFHPHKGGVLLILGLSMSMHVLSRGWRWPLVAALPLGAGLFLSAIRDSYSMNRLLGYLDPWADEKGRGYQIIQGLIAFNNGRIGGVGLGQGMQKYFIPEAQTDYIFPIIGEEFGLAGALFVIALYAVWAFSAYRLYRRAQDDRYISVLIWGLTASVILPMFINLGGVTNLLPLTGLPLPFLSAGGSAMIVMWLKIGVLMSIKKEIFLRERTGKEK